MGGTRTAGGPLAPVRRVRAAGLGSLEEFIYEGERTYDTPDAARRVEWIAQAAEHHLATNPYFSRIAAKRGFTVEQLRDTGDLSLVPVLSSGLFKRRDLRSETAGHVKLTMSSGTQGTQSVVPRDQPTMELFVGTVLHGLREFLGASDVREALVLGPPTEAAGDIWFSYVLSLVNLVHDTHFFVRGDDLRTEELVATLSRLDDHVEPALVAPPALLMDALQWMEEHDEAVDLADRNAFVVTAGGWKRRADDAVSRDELTRAVGDRLGVAPARVRDAYNMVELNTVIFECEHHRKHVPPWLAVLVRRPADMSLASPGEVGVLCFLDPTARSYPAFIFCDDLGRLQPDPCPCGRAGDTLTITRRVNTIEQRGCGLRLERYGRNDGASTER